MKKIFLLSLLIWTFLESTSIAQCIDAIGINPPEIQNGYYILAGWGVNEFPNAITWTRMRHCSSLYPWNFKPWIESVYILNPDSCTGWMLVDMIDTTTLSTYEYIQYQVFMITGAGDYFESEIVETNQRKTPSAVYYPPNFNLQSKTTILTGDLEKLELTTTNHSQIRFTSASLDAIRIIDNHTNIILLFNPSNQVFNLRIYNIIGTLLDEYQVNSQYFEIPLFQNQLPELYILELNSGTHRRIEKILVK